MPDIQSEINPCDAYVSQTIQRARNRTNFYIPLRNIELARYHFTI